MGNKQGQASAVEEEVSRDQNGEEAEEEVVLPPPMKPISEPLLVPSDDTLGQRVSIHFSHNSLLNHHCYAFINI